MLNVYNLNVKKGIPPLPAKRDTVLRLFFFFLKFHNHQQWIEGARDDNWSLSKSEYPPFRVCMFLNEWALKRWAAKHLKCHRLGSFCVTTRKAGYQFQQRHPSFKMPKTWREYFWHVAAKKYRYPTLFIIVRPGNVQSVGRSTK